MDINLSYTISSEDLVGVLRTILLFLESINFKATSAVLQNECSSKGFSEVVSVPAKLVLVHPSIAEPATSSCGGLQQSHQGNQTDFPYETDTSCNLEGSDHDVIHLENNLGVDPFYVYHTKITNISDKPLSENIFDKYSTHIMVSENVYLQKRHCLCCTCDNASTRDTEYTVEQLILESTDDENTSPNKKTQHSESKRSVNTIETEIPSKMSAKKSSSQVLQKNKKLRKTHSNPTLKTNDYITKSESGRNTEESPISDKEEINNIDCKELRKKFRQLQTEHQKLMGVTTELTVALQTHILGQSENLNSMLNNCKNIYPDLFQSMDRQKSKNCQCILNPTKNTSTENVHENLKPTTSNKSTKIYHQEVSIKSNEHSLPSKIVTITSITPNVIVDDFPNQDISKTNKFQISTEKVLDETLSSKIEISSEEVLQSELQNSPSLNKNVSNNKTIKNKSENSLSSSASSKKNMKDDENWENVAQRQSSPLSNKSVASSKSGKSKSKSSTRFSSQTNIKTENKNNENDKFQSSLLLNKDMENDKVSENVIDSSLRCNRSIVTNKSTSISLNETVKLDKICANTSQTSLSPTKKDENFVSPLPSKASLNKNTEDVCTEEHKYNDDNVVIEIKSISSGHSAFTTILVPKSRRPHSTSSIVLAANPNNTSRPNSKKMIRQISSKSCDEYLLRNSSTEKTKGRVIFKTEDDNINEIHTSDSQYKTNQEATATHCSYQPSDMKNTEQQTKLVKFESNDGDKIQPCDVCNELPEIFVTTENLEKLSRERKDVLTSNSNSSSPRNRYFELDFKKLKKDLLNGNDDLKLALIQALRWRITQSDSEIRDQVISSYIRHDLLGLHSAPNSCGQSTMELYYSPNKETPHPLQEGMARLVNTFASLTLGRDYLCQDDDLLVSLLVPLIIGTHYSKVNLDDVTHEMLMATLQKLSIRKRQRIRMISAGLVEYLVPFLATNHSTISEYCMEYSTALFMNLCLHHEARERLHPIATDVVSLLADLLNTKHQCCLPYVNGAMYSLLRDPYINTEAQRLNFAKLIDYHINRTDGEMQKQLQFILKLHLEGSSENDCGCDPTEAENEIDLLEPELNSGDPIKQPPSGEELLKNYKLLFSVYGSQVYAIHLKCLCRPVTPIPRSLNITEQLSDKMTESDENNIEKGTNCQDKQVLEQPEQKKCTCFPKKPKHVENPHVADDKLKSNNEKLCRCKTTTNQNAKKYYNSDRTSLMKAKPAGSTSDPTTNFKSNLGNSVKKDSASQQSSRSNSPDMSFCEETKQFYHTPAKTGIFEPQKQKKLHRVAPSFTRTIPMPSKIDPSPSVCNNPYCPHPYSKSMPVTPIENSSVRNPPYALDYPNCFTTCYRESYSNQMANLNANNCKCKDSCSKSNKYSCNCYNVIKGYIDQTSQDNINNNSTNKTENDRSIGSNRYNTSGTCATSNPCICSHCQNLNNFKTNISCVHNNDFTNSNTTTNHVNNLDVNSDGVNFSYEELLTTVSSGGHDHVCPNAGVECHCYDSVFQSRPKILRTPPY